MDDLIPLLHARRGLPTRRKRDMTLVGVLLAAVLTLCGWGTRATLLAIDARYVHVDDLRARRDTVARQRLLDSMLNVAHWSVQEAHNARVDSALVDIGKCLHRPASCQ